MNEDQDTQEIEKKLTGSDNTKHVHCFRVNKFKQIYPEKKKKKQGVYIENAHIACHDDEKEGGGGCWAR